MRHRNTTVASKPSCPCSLSEEPNQPRFSAERYTEIGSLLLDTYENPAAANCSESDRRRPRALLPRRASRHRSGACSDAEPSNVLAMELGTRARAALGMYLARGATSGRRLRRVRRCSCWLSPDPLRDRCPASMACVRRSSIACNLRRHGGWRSTWISGNEVFRSFFVFRAGVYGLEQAVAPGRRVARRAVRITGWHAWRRCSSPPGTDQYEECFRLGETGAKGRSVSRAKELVRWRGAVVAVPAARPRSVRKRASSARCSRKARASI